MSPISSIQWPVKTTPTIIYRQCLWHWQWNSCNNIYLSTASSKHNVKNHYKTTTQQHFSKKLNLFASFCKNLKMSQWGTQGPERTDSWKSLKSKISCQAPFNIKQSQDFPDRSWGKYSERCGDQTTENIQ